jgi:hypothetical protein
MTTKDAGHAGYVEEALLLGGYALDAAAVARVKIEFARIAANMPSPCRCIGHEHARAGRSQPGADRNAQGAAGTRNC